MYNYTSRYTTSYSENQRHRHKPTAPAIVAAVLRDISERTSYQTVRLVFRHYTHLTPSSCTSEQLRASSTLSSTFTQHTYSSPSFGSHRYALPPSTHSVSVISLVRVPRRVKYTFAYHTHTFIFSHFNHSTYPLSVISPYLALDTHHHLHSGCNTKQPYSQHPH